MGGGGGVHHHLVEGGAPFNEVDEAGELDPGDQLVGARQRQGEEAVDVLGIQVGAPGGDLAQGFPVLLLPAAERRAGGELGGEQDAAAGWDRSGLAREADAEGVTQGGGGIGGDGEDAAAGFGGGDRGGGGAGRLADAALAAEET
jgi:hypothetical protein